MKGIARTFLFALFSASLFAAPPGKSVICHHDSEGGFWTPISISDKAVDSHFSNHDDGYPNGATSATGTDLDENCEVVVESCPCFTYEMAMDVTSFPGDCQVFELPDFSEIFYDLWSPFPGYLWVFWDTDEPAIAHCEYQFPPLNISTEIRPEDGVVCSSIAKRAILASFNFCVFL
jgi:hypothetical protein